MKNLFIFAVLLSSVSAYACGDNEICKGDRVNFSSYVGTAVEAFSNGNVKINVDGYSGYTFKSENELGKGVSCFKKVCVNDRTNFSGYAARVVEVFTNGTVKLDVDGYAGYTYKSTRELGVSVNCFDKVCAKDRVNFSSYVGRVVEVYTNGTAKIDVDGYAGYTYKSTRELGVAFRCSDKLCVSDRVNFGSYTGTALEIFSNGTVKVDVDGYAGYSFKSTSELGYELRCYN